MMTEKFNAKFKKYRSLANQGGLDILILGELMVLGDEQDMRGLSQMQDDHRRLLEMSAEVVQMLENPFYLKKADKNDIKNQLKIILGKNE